MHGYSVYGLSVQICDYIWFRIIDTIYLWYFDTGVINKGYNYSMKSHKVYFMAKQQNLADWYEMAMVHVFWYILDYVNLTKSVKF